MVARSHFWQKLVRFAEDDLIPPGSPSTSAAALCTDRPSSQPSLNAQELSRRSQSTDFQIKSGGQDVALSVQLPLSSSVSEGDSPKHGRRLSRGGGGPGISTPAAAPSEAGSNNTMGLSLAVPAQSRSNDMVYGLAWASLVDHLLADIVDSYRNAPATPSPSPPPPAMDVSLISPSLLRSPHFDGMIEVPPSLGVSSPAGGTPIVVGPNAGGTGGRNTPWTGRSGGSNSSPRHPGIANVLENRASTSSVGSGHSRSVFSPSPTTGSPAVKGPHHSLQPGTPGMTTRTAFLESSLPADILQGGMHSEHPVFRYCSGRSIFGRHLGGRTFPFFFSISVDLLFPSLLVI